MTTLKPYPKRGDSGVQWLREIPLKDSALF